MPPNESKTKKKVFVSDPEKKPKDYQIDESIEKSPDKEKRRIFLSLFERSKKDAKDDFKSVPFFQLFRFATKLDIFLMFIGTVGSLANSATLPLMLIVFMNIFDSFTDFGKFCNVTNTTNVSFSSFSTLNNQMQEQALYLLYLGIATHVLSYMQVTFWLIASQRQTRTIRKRLFQSILKQDVGWFDVYKTGELNNRLSDDVNKIRDGIGDKCGNSLQYASTFLVCVIIALVKGWKLTLVVLSLSPLLFASSLLFTKSTENLTKSELTAYARAGNIAQEVFTAIRTVFAFNGSKKEHQRYLKNLDEAKFYGIKKGFLNGVLMGFLWLTIFGSYALGFWYGWSLTTEVDPVTGKSAYSIGKILLVFFAILIGVFSLGNAGPFFGTAATARAAAYEIFQIIDRVPPIDAFSNEGKKLDNLIGNIEFKNVKFHYPSRPEVPILKGVNFKVDSGVTCALVGSSGCGKSTCIQLLQRFYDPIEGSVLIDDLNMKDLNVNWLRGQIGVVNQEPILFGTSIAENIKFGKKDATKDEIIQAAINANAHDFIMTLPDKYDTPVGDRGGQLSGGQKQRIAIARALVRNPKILLLDEATSALDNESESIVQAALDRARLGRTTIIVAHRLSTIRNADIIFAFEKGEIKEIGTHETLMEKKGIYYNLVITQTKPGKKTKSEDDDSNDSVENESTSDDGSGEVEVNETTPNITIRNSETRVKSLSNINIGTVETSNKKEDQPDKKEKKSFMDYFKKGKKEPEEPKEKAPSMKKVFYMNRPEWTYIIIGCIASVIAGGIQPAFGIVLSKAVAIFSSCSYDDQKAKIQTYCIIFIAFAVASFIAYIIQNGMFAVAGEELTKRIRSKAFKAMLSQEIGWFDDLKNSVGVLTTKLAVEAAAVQGATGVRLGFVLMNVSNLGVGIIIAFAFSWPITLLVLGFIPFLILGGALQTKMLAGFSSFDKKNLEETGKITNESIGNIRTVAQLNKEAYFVEKYNEKVDIPFKKGIQSANVNGFILGLTTSVLFYAIAAAYSLGAYLIDKNLYGMTLENIMLVFNCVLFGAQSVGQASAMLPDYAKAKEAIKSMFELFDRVPLINNWESADSNGLKLADNEFIPEIQLNHVEFTYPSRKETKILRGINLKIERGQKVALVGSSGCGKSTVTQLLERFYDPDSGTISLSNKNLKEFDLQWLRSQISIVSQEPILFDISIRDNIAYGDNSREVTLEEIVEAAKKANIHDFISNLPKGYDTNVGSKGTQLSGGQKQRIAIARALISNPKILLLDEATSALDTESEKLVQDALDKAQEGRTCIIIAHRLSTIKNCDLIFVIKNGNVLEAGTHDELIARNGFYSKLNGQHR